jgi:hypothetical protein
MKTPTQSRRRGLTLGAFAIAALLPFASIVTNSAQASQCNWVKNDPMCFSDVCATHRSAIPQW